MKMKRDINDNYENFKKIFSVNNILTQVVSYGAWLILIMSVAVLAYLSFVEKFEIAFDWKTVTIFSAVTIMLSWMSWNTFYRKKYESTMNLDIDKQESKEYSIHSRYYVATKDWAEADLQLAIDKFNEEYEAKWLRWVEKRTGKPIKTKKEVLGDLIITTKGIEDLPYKGFKHKIIMWRIKHHKYPESGYKTSMEILSLLSYNDSNFNRRDLRADKKYYVSHSIKKIITSSLLIMVGASLIPEMIDGNWWGALLKLILALGTLFTSTFLGAMNGVQGARKKLSIIEEVCGDLERWAEKKPILAPYKEPVPIVPDGPIEKDHDEAEIPEVTNDIFNRLNITKK